MAADKKDPVYFAPPGSPVVPASYDTRIRLKSQMRGVLTQADLKKYLESLPDDAANAVVLNYSDVVGGTDDSST